MEVDVTCPACGELTPVHPDEEGGTFIEDCTTCCRPMEVRVKWRGGVPDVTVAPAGG
jgi:hypothetical protein